MQETEPVTDEGRSEGEDEDDQESMQAVATGRGTREARDGDPCNEPRSNKTDPPRVENTNLDDEDPRRKSKVRIMKLRELQASEILRRDRVSNLVVQDPITTRHKSTEQAITEHGYQPGKANLWV